MQGSKEAKVPGCYCQGSILCITLLCNPLLYFNLISVSPSTEVQNCPYREEIQRLRTTQRGVITGLPRTFKDHVLTFSVLFSVPGKIQFKGRWEHLAQEWTHHGPKAHSSMKEMREDWEEGIFHGERVKQNLLQTFQYINREKWKEKSRNKKQNKVWKVLHNSSAKICYIC